MCHINIRDIASIAGVSVSTVSKVINGKDQDISAKTRKRVLEVVREYQYVPYSKIRKSMSGKSHLLSVLIAEGDTEYTPILGVIEKQASKSGYSIVVYTLDGIKRHEERQMKVMGSRNVDGFLLIGNFRDRKGLIEQIGLADKPCVILGADVGDMDGTSAVIYDESSIGYEASRYLLQKEHVNIGCIFSAGTGMEDGYKRALYEAGIPYEAGRVFHWDGTDGDGKAEFKSWLSNNCTAVFCGSVENTICLYQRFQELGVLIPDDVSVVCGQDSSYLELLNPPVTSVACMLPTFGKAAVSELVELIETKEEYKKPPAVIPFTIKERESTSLPSAQTRGQKLVVVGSMNMDVTISVPHIPADGETLIAEDALLLPGGKGANQAVGASKLGGKVYLIGCLGNDREGKEIYNALVTNKVHTNGILFDGLSPTGKAYINVSNFNRGESTIVIYPGANQKLNGVQIQKNEDLFDEAKYCLLSLEIPTEAASYAVALCKRKGTDIILKPSGVDELDRQFIDGITYFVPNRKELEQLVPGNDSMERKADRLWRLGAKNVIITLGKDGCYLKNEECSRYFPAADFQPVDTTGGADAFISALAVYLSEGISLVHAIGFATYCAGLSITRKGVQSAMPDRGGVDMYRDVVYAQFPSEGT